MKSKLGFANQPNQDRGSLLELAPTLKICNFETVKAITTKFDEIS